MTLNELNKLVDFGYITDVDVYSNLKSDPELLSKTNITDVVTHTFIPDMDQLGAEEPEESVEPTEPTEPTESVESVEPVELEDSPIVVEEVTTRKSTKK